MLLSIIDRDYKLISYIVYMQYAFVGIDNFFHGRPLAAYESEAMIIIVFIEKRYYTVSAGIGLSK